MSGLPNVAVVAKRGHDIVMFVLKAVPQSAGALAPAREACRKAGAQLLWARRAARVLKLKRYAPTMEEAA